MFMHPMVNNNKSRLLLRQYFFKLCYKFLILVLLFNGDPEK